jgi:hypothetical protein
MDEQKPDPPIPVKVEGVVETKPADGAKPASETTVEKHEVTKTVGDAVQLPPPAVVADDAIRFWLALATIIDDAVTCLVILVLLFLYGNAMSKDVLAIVGTIIGSIIGYRARDTATVMGYEFGSSSGSTAKDYIKK